ncbi:MAG TPA: L-aspartate oxidase, partial [Syntrophobacteraceae bacterium]|nr:L-aspartate oxidase [Syntrophobacteraceae bacterium]
MEYQFDFLVLGSGIAGLSYALKVAQHGSVAVITKKDKKETSTNYAQGGIATVLDPDDSFQLHVEDTVNSGDGLCHLEVVERVIRSGPERIRELVEIGVEFNRGRSTSSPFDLGREGGHSRNRIVHAQDFTGRALEQALIAAAEQNANIQFFENHFAIDLIIQHRSIRAGAFPVEQEDICRGAYVFNS